MILAIDRDGHILWCNRRFEQTLGWSLEEARSRDIIAELYPDPDYRRNVLAFVQRATRDWAEFRTRTRNGETIDTAWMNALLPDGTCVGVGQDITQRKQPAGEILSSHENRVLDLVAAGKTNKEIAVVLGIGHKAVKTTLTRIFQKLRVTRRSQAAAIYARRSRS